MALFIIAIIIFIIADILIRFVIKKSQEKKIANIQAELAELIKLIRKKKV